MPWIFCLFAAGLLLRCLWLWQPARQVILHQDHLLDSAEHRDWKRFGGFIDAQYSDRWKHDKPFLIHESSEILSQFFSLTIGRELVDCKVQGGRATVTTRLKLQGQGTPIAMFAASAVNELNEPFTFRWKRNSWKPWDWELISADQPQLNLDHMEGM